MSDETKPDEQTPEAVADFVAAVQEHLATCTICQMQRGERVESLIDEKEPE